MIKAAASGRQEFDRVGDLHLGDIGLLKFELFDLQYQFALQRLVAKLAGQDFDFGDLAGRRNRQFEYDLANQ